ncbi:hypothetical protein VC83_08978 [Pseudogymnoascus destructans]|uniref:Zn(2)-C6 fungal-type domain-containing protein n=2 Tax=Pseudogymnoascus destructans TaxID=655981 RepID=L8GC38_PSED2|nr:uncharacterized protein VC83_08978 [Pseudogymnoascus destructans]ELR10228.1 hypothetical protein GMDG_04617 [Pseudogymnoascus destructans 20631-21]OAF54717.2 hypothetical protein VC83_08978 [Pseudogymnoascus destructans]
MVSASKKEWATHDAACASCRTRKIRCGREKPMCGCCIRDQVECVYSPALKRVNHVKVLSHNLGDIQDRVVKMQGELSWLTTALKRSNIAGQPELTLPRDVSITHGSEDEVASIQAGHVDRNGVTQIERYHGPRTLVSLCLDFAADLASCNGNTNNEVVTGLVNHLLFDSTRVNEGSLDLLEPGSGRTELNTCNLPPKHLLSVMLDSFVKQADYSTNIFCRRSIQEAIERVYEEPSTPASEPWALCFNLIILLTLGSDNPVRSDDPFVRPMLQAAQAMAEKPSCFMSTRFANVQALALYSHFVQQYHTDNQTLGDSLFARACVLATESGLHQADSDLSPASDLSVVEAEERQKVFRSLYIRDRFSMIAYGALAWLPSADQRGSQTPGKSSEQGGIVSNQLYPQHTPHWKLAGIQDELRCLLYSTDAPPVSKSGRRVALARLQQKLKTWAETYKIPSPNRPTTVHEISLHLAFLGTRILMLESESDTDDAACPALVQVIDDARLSCLLIAISCNQNLDQALTSQVDSLLSKTHFNSPKGFGTHLCPSAALPTSVSSTSTSTFPSALDAPPGIRPPIPGGSNFSSVQDPIPTPLPLHRITNVFPIAAIFVLARHILDIDKRVPPSQYAPAAVQSDKKRTTEITHDILLLEALLFCFRSKKPPSSIADHGNISSDTLGSKLGRTIQNLVNIIHASMNPTCRVGADDDNDGDGEHEDGDDDDDEEDTYSFEPMLTLEPSLPPDAFSNYMGMPGPSSYSSNGISPSQLNVPMQSPWDTPQDSMSNSSTTTPMWSAQNWISLAPLNPLSTMMPERQFDISTFMDQVERSNVDVQDGGQDQGLPMEQQQQQVQCVSEPARKRPRKRPRANDHQVHGDHS